MVAPQFRKLCLLLVFILVGLLFVTHQFDIMKPAYALVKDFMNTDSEKPNQPSRDSLIAKPTENLEQMAVGEVVMKKSTQAPEEPKQSLQDSVIVNPKENVEQNMAVVEEVVKESTKTPEEPLLDSLMVELQESLEQIAKNRQTPKEKVSNDMKCYFEDEELQRHGCPPGERKGCIQENMSKELRHRVEDWMHPDLQIAPKYLEIIREFQKEIEGYYHLVIVSAASSHFYYDSQAMLKDIHEKIFPLVPNATLVVYDIGLSARDRSQYQKFCKCKLIRFPFTRLPMFCREVKCLCWKSLVVRAHLANGDIVLLMDETVRYTKPERFLQTLKRAEMYGLQQHRVMTQPKTPIRGMPSLFHRFGFTPCAFKDYPSSSSDWAMYRNSPLIEHAVLDPWTACGLNQSCSCPRPYRGPCPPTTNFDQHNVTICQTMHSPMSIILARLWMEEYSAVAAIQDSFTIQRGHPLRYFEEIERKQINNAGG